MLLEQVLLMSTTASARTRDHPPRRCAIATRPRPLSSDALWLILFFASLFAPPVLDDADGTHANAARQMALSGDWVTLRVNNRALPRESPTPLLDRRPQPPRIRRQRLRRALPQASASFS